MDLILIIMVMLDLAIFITLLPLLTQMIFLNHFLKIWNLLVYSNNNYLGMGGFGGKKKGG